MPVSSRGNPELRTERYAGMIRERRSPSRSRALGREPSTSPRPPVLARGVISGEAMSTCSGGVLETPSTISVVSACYFEARSPDIDSIAIIAFFKY